MILGELLHQKNTPHDPEEVGSTTAFCSPEKNHFKTVKGRSHS